MIKTIFSAHKGYYIPDLEKESPHEAIELGGHLASNGFDTLDWNKRSDDYGGEDYDDGSDSVEDSQAARDLIFKESGYHHPNGFVESLLTTTTTHVSQKSLESESEDDGMKTKKSMTKSERKELKKKQKEEKKKRKKLEKQEKLRHHHKSSEDYSMDGYKLDKIRILNGLFTQACKMMDGPRALKFEDIVLSQGDLSTLLEDAWLNDNIIGFIYEYLTASQTRTTLKRRVKYMGEDKANSSVVLLLPTFSFLLANDPSPEQLKDVLPNMDGASFIFMPVNDSIDFDLGEGGSHWSLVLFSLKDRKAFVYDSMFRANETESLQLIKNTETLLDTSFEVIFDEYSPQQINGSDCGPLTCAMTALLLDRVINVNDNTFISLSMKNVLLSAIDARIFMLGTITNLMKKQKEITT
ncbi:hypothetical protein FOA43_000657 [Brettanomyces nanus]|uniref:Ubiquitin-like protease family profile domain-containing protein n=1 Tax=Eeniella nana TaxID=13502 RepID=A0A875RTC1_EENNA|nr:uncharacterized protein FOA43_000657 [Brettanomyces nanus]QPG73347.1 hypothetical protein FOA43_000657 [Brettanomyces nanus]